jgi:hypothetical protein
MSAFLLIDILLGFKDVGIAANWGATKEDCHIVPHLRLGPQRLSGFRLNRCVHDGCWVDKLDIFKQQTYLLDIGSMLIFALQLKAGLILDPLMNKDLGRSWRSGGGSRDGRKPALLEN